VSPSITPTALPAVHAQQGTGHRNTESATKQGNLEAVPHLVPSQFHGVVEVGSWVSMGGKT
jgi:hypothetical protein